MSKNGFGLIGLAVMGQNLALNVESRGFRVSVYNRTTATMEKFLASSGKGKSIGGFRTPEEFVASLERPRRIMLMVQAGPAVDSVIGQLMPLVEPGDVLVDGGNSLYTDTERRAQELESKGILFLGAGVSGGEEGALKGPSIMPGGSFAAWEVMEPVFKRIAAQVDGEPCCRFMGPGGAGHYVKMVHNGIEYGDMQLICEAYDLLRNLPGTGIEELHRIFAGWNEGELNSYLIEITSKIFTVRDEETGLPVVDLIMDRAGQKGTGKWTLLSAIEMGTVVSTINAAVEARILSSWKEKRVRASAHLRGSESLNPGVNRDEFIDAVGAALYASKIVSYTQGMDMLVEASRLHDWGLQLGDIATIWRGGCIIRAKFLNRIKEAYEREASLSNLMLDPFFQDVLNRSEGAWRKVVAAAVSAGVPVPAFSASLAYYDSYRQERLPANLLQAQRDYFGAHTYERIDRPAGEFFHTDWPDVIE
ncbi:MAG TPA: decarboxylating NADP(+)-dependent phosphogluconate dehydrogenase [Verrucomicrobiales bacterium]|nr:decarboxylating NADP(+)-dependent phosphogluconate dehydrogenase [Verrucomicrobiales bacterium]